MADEMKPTPRGFISGLFSDVLGRTLNMPSMPRTGIPSLDLLYANRNSLFNMAGVGDVQKTAERISYGQPLTTGSGMTLRPREEAINAGMTVIPLVGQGGRVANQAAMTAGRAGARYAERVVPQVMERGGLPAQLLGDISRGSVSPLDVYHGTPHTLPPTERNPLGEFDASKIGTGEGAQAYGYGIYVAENPSVAKDYQVKLSSTGSAKNLANQYGGVDGGLAEAKRRVENYKQLIADGGGGAMERVKSLLRISEKNLEDLTRIKAGLPENTGSLYKIDLPDEKIAKMLDYDKPMSEQSSEVQKILLPYQKEIGGSFGTGEQTLKAIAFERRMKGLDDSPQAVANQLQEMGITGVRYLDDGSRGISQKYVVNVPDFGGYDFSSLKEAQAFIKSNPQLKTELIEPQKATSNFVVFPNEEKSMTILERNGMPATQIESPTFTDPFGNTIGSSIR